MVIVRKSKNSSTDIELFLHLQHFSVILSLYYPLDFFPLLYNLKKSHSMRKRELRLYFFQDMYILACECNSLLCEEIQYSLMNEMTNMWHKYLVCPQKDVSKPNHDSLILLHNFFFPYPTDL